MSGPADRLVLLDSEPLGLASNPRDSEKAARCKAWLRGLLAAGVRVTVPEITDYDIRREFIRAGRGRGSRASTPSTGNSGPSCLARGRLARGGEPPGPGTPPGTADGRREGPRHRCHPGRDREAGRRVRVCGTWRPGRSITWPGTLPPGIGPASPPRYERPLKLE